ncbi:MAG: electron transport complex subunit RsxC [Bacteroidales bacterium]|jgi:electron transport complex protein RnfC|nr:electron transport complex subunit RsxC [Bacteroidales bacterium]
MKTFKIGGIHPDEHKIRAEDQTITLDLPKQGIVFVSQHLGAPSECIVAKGDKVKVGQLLTKNENFIGANVHSPFSGTVNKIDTIYDASGYRKEAIVIDVEGDKWLENIDRSEMIKREISLDKNEIIAKVKEMGIVGLGGACFPTHVKLMVPEGRSAEYLIINGVECEPYLTDDYRLMVEHGEQCLVGVSILQKALGVKTAYIGIENNKPKAIEHLKKLANSFEGIEVVALQVKYPQGAEKQLINAITGREVPSGKLPIDAGCVVCNICTAHAVYEAVQKNKPLIDRIVTVTGLHVEKVSNLFVRIGTPISMLLDAVGGVPENTSKIISGGPMMGKALFSADTAVTKGTSALLLMDESLAHRGETTNCIRCAKCVNVCPMGLEPYLLGALVENENFERAENESVMDCIECGSCLYTCPSYRPLLDCIRVGKYTVRVLQSKRK